MSLLEIAFSWVVQGFAVIPILYKDKTPSVYNLLGGKWNQYKDRLPTTQELTAWCNQQINLAIVTGWNNLVVIDFDNMEIFDLWRSLISVETYMVKTNRGVHVYVRIDEQPEPRHTDFIDIKSRGGYVLIPPSVHPSGHIYTPMNDLPILSVGKLNDVLPDLFIPVKQEPKQELKLIVPLSMDPWERASNTVEITNDLVNQIRASHKIENYFPDAERSGDHWLKAKCPFHDDHSPSFWIDTRRQICGCHVCQMKPMDIINLVARMRNLSNQDAIIYLAQSI